MKARQVWQLIQAEYKSRRKRPAPMWFTLVVFVLLWPKLKLMSRRHRALERRAERLLRMRSAGGSCLISPDMVHDPDGYPIDPELRASLAAYLGRPLPRNISRELLKLAWRNPLHQTLYVFDAERVYVDLSTPASPHRGSPFDVASTGGFFVFMTNRSANFLSYLHPSLDVHSISRHPRCPGMGYTNLWLLEHVRGYITTASEPIVWPPLPMETDYKASPGNGPWLALRDPQFDKWREPSSWRTIIGRFFNAEEAHRRAHEFCEQFQISTCVARLVRDEFWH